MFLHCSRGLKQSSKCSRRTRPRVSNMRDYSIPSKRVCAPMPVQQYIGRSDLLLNRQIRKKAVRK